MSVSDEPKQPFMLMCRSEDKNGSGVWIMVEVKDKRDGDQVARGLQATMADGDIGSVRCELAVNTQEGFARWAKESNKRKQARTQFLQQRAS